MYNNMEKNRATMSEIVVARKIIFFIDITICIFNLIFFIVGGFMFFFLLNLIAVAAAFVSGTIYFRKRNLHIALIVVNIIAAILYMVFQPVDGLLYIGSFIQHIICIMELLGFTIMGAKEKYLMNEEGYPYFTENTADIRKYKEYHAYNNINSGKHDMEDIDISGVYRSSPASNVNDSEGETFGTMDPVNIKENNNFIPKRSSGKRELYMDEISGKGLSESEINPGDNRTSEMVGLDYESFVKEQGNQKSESEKQIYSEKFDLTPNKFRSSESEFDPNLMEQNRRRMISFNNKKKLIFVFDIIMIFITIFRLALRVSHILFESPAYLLLILNIIAVVVASLITETCMNNPSLCFRMILLYAGVGFMLVLLLYKYTLPIAFFSSAFQMVIVYFLSKDYDYLKSQEGYPYFNRAAYGHQKLDSQYHPEHNIDFSSKRMDEI